MLSLASYMTRLYKIKWFFDIQHVQDLEDILFVDFKSEKNYFIIEKILYSPYDILRGLEQLDFIITKKNDD